MQIKNYMQFKDKYRLRCEDTLSRRNPRWNVTDDSGQTLGQVWFSFNPKKFKQPSNQSNLRPAEAKVSLIIQLRLQGVGFSAVSIPWRNVRGQKVKHTDSDGLRWVEMDSEGFRWIRIGLSDMGDYMTLLGLKSPGGM